MHDSNIKSELEQHHNDCYGWALHCCKRDKEMASEVLQISYLKILEKQNTFSGRSEFRTWVFIVIKNTAIDAWKKQRKSIKLICSENNFPDAGYDAGAGYEFDRKLEKQFFTEALNRLSERQRQILQLVFYHDMSINQSAEVLNISQGSARKHYYRAKRSLADWFLKKGITEFK
jgi:RNA polymerase sigma-70 factor (ECF subfamily)